jgi:hypothetical protein
MEYTSAERHYKIRRAASSRKVNKLNNNELEFPYVKLQIFLLRNKTLILIFNATDKWG